MTQAFNINCMDAMRITPDKFYDLACLDPEWGRGQDGRNNRSNSAVLQKTGKRSGAVKSPKHTPKSWDRKPAAPEYFQEIIRISKHQIIWGENYYHTNFGPGRIIWDKLNDGAHQSDCEIAYNSLTDRVDIFRFKWRGMIQGKSITEGHIQQGNKKLNEKIIHPTQKPVALYKWLLSKYAQPGWKILDTHMGSGSSRIAAYDMGFDYTGYEIDKEYFDLQEERFSTHVAKSPYNSQTTPKHVAGQQTNLRF